MPWRDSPHPLRAIFLSKMAGKGTVELLKNAVVVNASVKHTATVSNS